MIRDGSRGDGSSGAFDLTHIRPNLAYIFNKQAKSKFFKKYFNQIGQVAGYKKSLLGQQVSLFILLLLLLLFHKF